MNVSEDRPPESYPGEAAIRDYLLRTNANRILSPFAWIKVAKELLSAAALLEEPVLAWWAEAQGRFRDRRPGFPDSPPLHRVYLLLVAFGLENLFKSRVAVTLSHDERFETLARGAFPMRLKTHDLSKLAALASFPQTKEDEEAFSRLTQAAIWRGRYPVGLDSNDQDTLGIAGRSLEAALFSEKDVARFKDLVTRVTTFVEH
jgi:hypothetical protein